jgi:CubicO group peptidase (beta-lactamase class C family)
MWIARVKPCMQVAFRVAFAANLCVWTLDAASAAGPSASPPPPADEARIQRIVDGLLPAVIIGGQPAPAVKLQEMMARLQVPGVSVAVIHDGAIDWARGYGFTNFGGAPVAADTLFYAPAIGKLMVAMAVLQLVDKKKLDLDADVNRYLKTWKVPNNSFTDQTKVTLRHLLANTAGTPVPGFTGYASDAPLPTLLQVLNGEKPANNPPIVVEAVPGTRWQYSSGGYAVVQQLLEDVTGQPFAKYMQDSVLAPIGMAQSTYMQPLPKERVAEVAMPFRAHGVPVLGGPQVYPVMASSGLWTTASDLARCAIEVQRALAGRSSPVISSAMAKELLAPGPVPTQPVGEGVENQGLGMGVGGKPEHRYFAHNSINFGYQSLFLAYDVGNGVVIMTNSESGLGIARQLLRGVAREYGWPDFQPKERTVSSTPDPATYDKVAGMYEMSSGGAIRISKVGNKLMVADPRAGDAEMYPGPDMHFFVTRTDLEFVFNVDGDGEVVDGAIQAPASQITITKVKEISVDPSLFDDYVGRYRFLSGRVLMVTREGNRLLMQLPNQSRLELFPLNEREFVPKTAVDAKVTFEMDEQRRVQVQWLQNNQRSMAKRLE